jgi:hypothetical protein
MRVLRHLGRRSLGDALALAQDDDPPAERHHNLHVVLDHHERVAPGVERQDVADQLVNHGRIDAGQGLVEEDDLGTGHERHAEVQELLLAVREIRREAVPEVDDAQVLEKLVRPSGRLRALTSDEPPEQGAVTLLGREQHVLEHSHLREQLDQLERARDPAAMHPVGAEPRDVLALEPDVAAGRAKDPGDAVEQRGLAGSVGADHPEKIARLHAQAHPAQRGKAEELLRQLVDFEERHASAAQVGRVASGGSGTAGDAAAPGAGRRVTQSHAPTRPLGMKSIIRITAIA